MKKAKVMLFTITIVAAISGTPAFKAHKGIVLANTYCPINVGQTTCVVTTINATFITTRAGQGATQFTRFDTTAMVSGQTCQVDTQSGYVSGPCVYPLYGDCFTQ